LAKKDKPNQVIAQRPATGVSPIELAATTATQQLIFNAAFMQQQSHGPLPQPEILKQYDVIVPGLAGRIVAMAEAEASHRRMIETRTIDIQVEDLRKFRGNEVLGQVFGFLIGISALACAAYVATHGSQWAAGLIGTTGVTGLVTTFILGRQFLIKQRQQDIDIAREIEAAKRASADRHNQARP